MSVTHTDVPVPPPAPLDMHLPSPIPDDGLEQCPLSEVLRLVGDKWTVLVLVLLGRRPHRYNELRHGIEAISQRMLTRTLRTLEENGLAHREVLSSRPPSVEYRLTPLGRSLLVPLAGLASWAVDNRPRLAASRSDHRR